MVSITTAKRVFVHASSFISRKKIIAETRNNQLTTGILLPPPRRGISLRCFSSSPASSSSSASSPNNNSISSRMVKTVNQIGTSINQDWWDDRIALQSKWKNPEKGWMVDVEWKLTEYGIGLFAKQDIKKGTILRVGRTGINMVEFNSIEDMEQFCYGSNGINGNEKDAKQQLIPEIVSYVSDYFYGFDPNYYTPLENDRSSIKTKSNDENQATKNLPYFYGLWFPGNGLNHSTKPNMIYLADNTLSISNDDCNDKTEEAKISKETTTKTINGINAVALIDICNGEQIFDDYRRFPPPPSFAIDFATKHDIEMNFVGMNDFV